MKKSVCLFLLFITFLDTYSAPSRFILYGKIKGAVSGNAVLSYSIFSNNNREQIKLTALIQKGSFLLKGTLNEPVEAKLKIEKIDVKLYIEPTQMNFFITKNHSNKFKLMGSKTHHEYELMELKTEKLDKLLDENYEQMNLIDKQLDSIPNDNIVYKTLSDKREFLQKQKDIIYKCLADTALHLLLTYPNSYYPLLSQRCLVYLSKGYLSTNSVRSAFDKIADKVKNSQQGIILNNYLKKRENTEIGKFAPNFNSPDMNGKPIILSGYRATNYVLLDFWASWCSPCIKGLPYLKNIYLKYHNKGLEIIGISSDRSIEDWKSSINKQQIFIWPQVLYIQEFIKFIQGYINKEDIEEKYPTEGIPRYILIDKDGKIIGKWVGYSEENEKDLDKVLKDIFGE